MSLKKLLGQSAPLSSGILSEIIELLICELLKSRHPGLDEKAISNNARKIGSVR